MQTYEQMIEILEDEKYSVVQEDYDEGYNNGLDYAIKTLKGLEKQEKTFLEELNYIKENTGLSMDDNYGIQ